MAKHVSDSPKTRGRRRALDPVSEPANIAPLTNTIPVVKAGERRAALQLERELAKDATASHRPRHSAVAVAATTGLLMISAMSGTMANTSGHGRHSTEPRPDTGMLDAVDQPEAPITADAKQVVAQARVEVTTEPAPPEPDPPAPVEPVAAEPEPVVEPAPPAPVQELPLMEVGGYLYQVPAQPPQPAPAPPSNLGQRILSAAYGQLGVWQDCTMLVTNSLAAVGIYFHDWPAGYMSLGTVIDASEAQPGDLLYYMDGGAGVPHIAVYAGNGMAVHGGWNGNQTVVFSAYVGSGPTFIRV